MKAWANRLAARAPQDCQRVYTRGIRFYIYHFIYSNPGKKVTENSNISEIVLVFCVQVCYIIVIERKKK